MKLNEKTIEVINKYKKYLEHYSGSTNDLIEFIEKEISFQKDMIKWMMQSDTRVALEVILKLIDDGIIQE